MGELFLVVQQNLGTTIAALVAVGGGAATVAYGLFQAFGKAWLDSKFNQRLAQLRHEQTVEIARLRVEIDSLLSATIRLQEKDFELLPQAWTLLDDAYSLTGRAVSPFRRYVRVEQMLDDEFEEWLGTTEFTETQKNRLRESTDTGRKRRYERFTSALHLHQARVAKGKLQAFILQNGILMPEQIKAELTDITARLQTMEMYESMDQELPGSVAEGELWKQYQDVITPIYKSIERQIQQRLQSHATALK